MSNHFTQGYALIIGVNKQADPTLAENQLSDVENDVQALYQVVTNSSYCAYPKKQVRVLLGEDATRENIRQGLKWLKSQIETDEHATGLIYFSGHGFRIKNDETGKQEFYLIPYDADAEDETSLSMTALSDELWVKLIQTIHPKRLLVMLDCCHAGATETKKVKVGVRMSKDGEGEGPVDPGMPPTGPKPIFIGKRFDQLSFGEGRTILRSSQDDELSWMYPEKRLSLFTYHLIEALTGHAAQDTGDTAVGVFELMEYLSTKVPETAQAVHQVSQKPQFTYHGSDNFPVALLMGGKGLEGNQSPDVETVIPSLPEPSGGNSATITGDENILLQEVYDSNITITNNSPGAVVDSTVNAGGDIMIGGNKYEYKKK